MTQLFEETASAEAHAIKGNPFPNIIGPIMGVAHFTDDIKKIDHAGQAHPSISTGNDLFTSMSQKRTGQLGVTNKYLVAVEKFVVILSGERFVSAAHHILSLTHQITSQCMLCMSPYLCHTDPSLWAQSSCGYI